MEKTSGNRKWLLILLPVLAVVLIGGGIAGGLILKKDRIKAVSMRLQRMVGTVSLFNEKGEEQSLLEQMRLHSGSSLTTGDQSLVMVSLDDTRLITMEENSLAEVKAAGKALEFDLKDGNLFFNVTEKLKADQSFEVTTSSMICGIRGTSGEQGYDEEGNDQILVTDGIIAVRARGGSDQGNKDGGAEEIKLSPGEKIVAKKSESPENGENKITLEKGTYELEELLPVTLNSIAKSPELQQRIAEATGFSAEKIVALAEIMSVPGSSMVGDASAQLQAAGIEDSIPYMGNEGRALKEAAREASQSSGGDLKLEISILKGARDVMEVEKASGKSGEELRDSVKKSVESMAGVVETAREAGLTGDELVAVTEKTSEALAGSLERAPEGGLSPEETRDLLKSVEENISGSIKEAAETGNPGDVLDAVEGSVRSMLPSAGTTDPADSTPAAGTPAAEAPAPNGAAGELPGAGTERMTPPAAGEARTNPPAGAAAGETPPAVNPPAGTGAGTGTGTGTGMTGPSTGGSGENSSGGSEGSEEKDSGKKEKKKKKPEQTPAPEPAPEPEPEPTPEPAPVPTRYSVNISLASSARGRLEADKSSAEPNEVVTITVRPDNGYELSSINGSYTDSASGQTGSLSFNEITAKEKYSFVMPQGNVSVSAAFHALKYEVTTTLVTGNHGSVGVRDEQGNSLLQDNNKKAAYGSRVTIVATPDNGYALFNGSYTSVAVTGAKTGSSVSVDISGATAAFTMPNEGVSIHVQTDFIKPVTGVRLKINNNIVSSNTIFKDDFFNLEAEILPDHNDVPQGVTWKSSDESVAVVQVNQSDTHLVKVTGKAPGTADIMVKTEEGGKTATCRVTVLEHTEYNLTVGQTEHAEVHLQNESLNNNSKGYFGDHIRIVITPDSGYTVSGCRVTKTSDGSEVSINGPVYNNNNTEYYFEMPASDVRVDVYTEGTGGGGSTTTATLTVQSNVAGTKTLWDFINARYPTENDDLIIYQMKSFSKSTSAPTEDQDDYAISSDDQNNPPVYLWYDDSEKAVKWYSEADTVYLESDISSLFNMNQNDENNDLSTVDFSGLDMSKVINTDNLFNGCARLKLITWGDGERAAIVSAQNMFMGCSELESIDLSPFTFSGAFVGQMFGYCSKLKTIYVDDGVSFAYCEGDTMFEECHILTGGNGTSKDKLEAAGLTDIAGSTYARVDEAVWVCKFDGSYERKEGNLGYFTRKEAGSTAGINYEIKVNEVTGGGGSISADKEYAAEETEVSIDIKPDTGSGYQLKTLSVRTVSGGSVPVNYSNGTHRFTMPDAPVEVTGEFTNQVASPSGEPDSWFTGHDMIVLNGPGDYAINSGVILEIPKFKTLKVAQGAALTVESGGRLVVNGTLLNYGTVTIKDGGTLDVSSEGILMNYSPHTLNNYGAIVNHGTIVNGDGDDNEGRINNFDGATLENHGTLENNEGSVVNNDGEIENHGTIENKDGAEVNNTGEIMGSGTIENEDGAVVNNDGDITGNEIAGDGELNDSSGNHNDGSSGGGSGSTEGAPAAPNPGSEPVPVSAPASDPSSAPEPEPVSAPAPEPEPVSAPVSEPAPVSAPVSELAPAPDPDPAPEPASATEPAPASEPSPAPASEAVIPEGSEGEAQPERTETEIP